MIKMFEKFETDKYKKIKILFITITLKKKSPIEIILWWIPIKSLREAIRSIYDAINAKYELINNNLNQLFQKHHNIENIVLEYYIQNNKNNIAKDYNDFITKLFNYNIIVSSAWLPEYDDIFKFLPIIFKNQKFKMVYYDSNIYADVYGFWGTRPLIPQFTIIKNALYNNKNVIFFEMGFIATIYSFENIRKINNYTQVISFVLDDLAPYYDSRYKNRLEEMLENKNLVLTKEQIERAKININEIIKNKITKYNHQPIYKPKIGKNKNKVLIVDQAYGDMSIAKGLANENTFKIMFETAIKDNTDADIIIKIHPDNYHNKGSLYFNNKTFERENIYLFNEEINPISLLEIVDKVYVCTSQLGFEALMMGKEVHVFGMPFYAGYGVTIDYQKCSRRTNKRSLEELFYITYINYSYYVNPDKENRCEIEDAINYLIKLRREYFLEFNIRCDDKNLIDLSKRDFSLNSGERQTAKTLDGIRKDHLLRYCLAANFLENRFNQNKTFGADIFCGNGYGSYLLASKLKNTEILSIDASKEAIELANNHYKIKNRIKFINKIFPFELDKDKYDYVISFESIEHIQNDTQFIETIISSIKNKGYWFLSTPNEEIMSLKKNNNKFHFRHYTNKTMNNIFKKYNLELIEQYGEDTYSIDKEGLITGTLSEEKMKLIKNYNGQFMIYILRVIKE